jgi:hypothetical protein
MHRRLCRHKAAHSVASSSCGASSSWRQSRQGRVGATDESGPLASGLVAPRAGVVSASTNPSMEGTMEVQSPLTSIECDSHYGRYRALRRRLGHMGRTRTRRLGPRPELEAEPGRRARHVHMMRVCVGTRTSASGPPAPVLAVGCRLALSIPTAHAAIMGRSCDGADAAAGGVCVHCSNAIGPTPGPFPWDTAQGLFPSHMMTLRRGGA